MAPLFEGAFLRSAPSGSDLRLVAQLRSTAASPGIALPRTEFRDTLRSRIVALASAQAVDLSALAQAPSVRAANAQTANAQAASAARPASPPATSWSSGLRVQRCLALTAGSLASLIAVTGIAAASSRSLPGDPFYPAKRASENVELRLAGGDAAKGAKHFSFAVTRLDEIGALLHNATALAGSDVRGAATVSVQAAGLAFGGSTSTRVRSALTDMDTETREGSELLTTLFRQNGELASLRVITSFSQRQGQQLSDLLPALPPSARDLAQASLGLVTQVGQQAQRSLTNEDCLAGCSAPGTAGGTPTGSASGGGAPLAGGAVDGAIGSGRTAAGAHRATARGADGGAHPQPSHTQAPQPQVLPAAQPTRDPRDGGSPTGQPSPTPAATPTPGSSPSATPPAPTASPSPSPSGQPLPAPLPQPPPLPIPLPTGLPTLIPTPPHRR